MKVMCIMFQCQDLWLDSLIGLAPGFLHIVNTWSSLAASLWMKHVYAVTNLMYKLSQLDANDFLSLSLLHQASFIS